MNTIFLKLIEVANRNHFTTPSHARISAWLVKALCSIQSLLLSLGSESPPGEKMVHSCFLKTADDVQQLCVGCLNFPDNYKITEHPHKGHRKGELLNHHFILMRLISYNDATLKERCY